MNIASDVLAAGRRRMPPRTFDVWKIREDFPILKLQVRGKPLVYLDNAATSQKPQVVIDTLNRYYTEENANIHRGVHYLSEKATQEYEDARVKVQHFLHAGSEREIIFVRSVTEAINLVAHCYGRKFIQAGDEIIISAMEHHSNIVPWQILCEEKGAVLRVIPIDDRGELLLDVYEQLLGPKTKFVAITHVSNALGTINPVRRIVEMAHRWNVPVLVDGAQGVPHFRVDVRELDCDFYGFSGHKLFGPTGIGVLYGKAHWLEAMPPYQGGGSMIRSVTFEKTTYAPIPAKYEAGTPHIAGAIGLGAAIDYLEHIGLDAIDEYEQDLLAYAMEVLAAIPGVRIYGTAREKASVICFTIEGVHPHDIGTILDREGIAIRTGHHCAQPVMDRFGVPAMSRASMAFYNTKAEIDALVAGIYKVKEVFG
ncbi:MAG TPA: cysteine desulfurase [Alphaproteobacteria bacterium]|nr:cysteine desulfurase [Alphaproteobacteria bacterium]